MKKILIAGDICPTKSNYILFENAEVNSLIGEELEDIITNADYFVFNLEVPLTDKESPIKKAGPNLIASTQCINGLKAINGDFYGLANNHILDQGIGGLKSTIKVLQDNNITFCGVGKNLLDADQGIVVDVGGLKLGLYCCAEHEFSIATDGSPGVNPFDALYSLDTISGLKNVCDFLIVLYHGGKEFYRYPSPRTQKICRRVIEKGADVVVMQHSHCVGCEERWKEGRIIYGQGDFLFDHGEDEFLNNSLMLSIIIDDANKFEIEYIPLKKNGVGVALSNNKAIINDYLYRSKELLQDGFVSKKYGEFAEDLGNQYIYRILYAKRPWFRIKNRLSKYRLQETYRGEVDMALLNYMECEAHNELMITAMKYSLERNIKE